MSLPIMSEPYRFKLQEFQNKILSSQTKIETWFKQKWTQHTPPFYGSVDIRNAGYKMASIDMNLFPGGFNNLNPQFIQTAAQAVRQAVERVCPQAQSALVVPENHTRNVFYLQNISALSNILQAAGFEVRLGSLAPEITEPTEFETASGNKILLEPLLRTRSRVHLADGFSPCLVLLNNDLSGGIPKILQDISQAVLPPLYSGWTTRRKTSHFAAYNRVADEFAALLDIDVWQINPYFEKINGLNFHEREGEDLLAMAVERMLAKIQAKYSENGIADKPFVIVKADAGTYGMGIMSVKSADEVRDLNRKSRNKMATVKEGLKVTEVIVQEGIHTYETLNGMVCEPVVYMIDRFVVGGFFRAHKGRGTDENLNASGMVFIPFSQDVTEPDLLNHSDYGHGCLYVYGVMARLSLLAASLELAQQPENVV